MSSHCLPGSAVDCSGPCSAGGPSSAPSRSTADVDQSCAHDSTTDPLTHFRYGTTYAPSMVANGEDGSTWSPEGSHARRSLPHQEAAELPRIDGPTCFGSFAMLDHSASSRKMCSPPPSNARHWSCVGSVITVSLSEHPPHAWALLTGGCVGGWLPTPTTRCTMWSRYMRRWPAYALIQDAFGQPVRDQVTTWLMGWPAGWTDTRSALATGRFRKWYTRSLDCWDGPRDITSG